MVKAGKKKKIFDGRYEILAIVGRGECSVVYQVRHVSAPFTEAALKVLLNKKGQGPNTDKLRKEALAMVSSRHKYVIRLDDFHSVDNICYLCMEFAAESDLRGYCRRKGGKLSVPQAERFLLQTAEALSFIHQSGIVHRDIKPDNILVVNDRQVRLADFGVAVLPGEESSLQELQRGIGTMDYMAPEVFQGASCDKRSDVYCLGVSFYELLSGIQPFEKVPLAQVLEVRKDGRIPHLCQVNPEVPAYIGDVIMEALAFDPAKRFPSAKEMLSTFLLRKSRAVAAHAADRPLVRKPAAPIAPVEPATPETRRPTLVRPAAPAADSTSPAAAREAAETAAAAPVQLEQAAQPAQPVPAQIAGQQDIESESNGADGDESEADGDEIEQAHEANGEQPERRRRKRRRRRRGRAATAADALGGESTTAVTATTAAAEPVQTAPMVNIIPPEIPPAATTNFIDATPPGITAPGGEETSAIAGREPPVSVSVENSAEIIPAAALQVINGDDTGRRGGGIEIAVNTILVDAPPAPAETMESEPLPEPEPETVHLMEAPQQRSRPYDRFQPRNEVSVEPVRLTGGPKAAPEEAAEVQDALRIVPESPVESRVERIGPERPALDALGRNQRQQKQPLTRPGTGPARRNRMSASPHLMTPVSRRWRRIAPIIMLVAVLFAADYLLRLSTNRGLTTRAISMIGLGESQGVIPRVAAGQLSFPQLPAGMYAGSITDLFPGHTLPLTIISFPAEHKLTVLVGMTGWTPADVDLDAKPDEQDDKSIKVHSNGFVLAMIGEESQGELRGTFSNMITRENGQWSVKPVN